MKYKILHNPKCSKSRKTLEILREHEIEPEIVEYLEQPPSAEELRDIGRRLDVPLTALIRRQEPAFRDADDLPSLLDEAALAGWLAGNIKVMQRPVVLTDDGRAVIGRPPEKVLELIDS